MEKEMQHIYQEIADTVNAMIPEEWEKFNFYAQISETGGGTYFFYNTPERPKFYQNSLDIPVDFTINEDEFTLKRRYLYDLGEKMRDIFKKYNQALWYSFTMSLERSGKFNIHYDYTDWFKTDYSFNDLLDIWEYKYLGNEPANQKKQALIERYFEEYPENPI